MVPVFVLESYISWNFYPMRLYWPTPVNGLGIAYAVISFQSKQNLSRLLRRQSGLIVFGPSSLSTLHALLYFLQFCTSTKFHYNSMSLCQITELNLTRRWTLKGGSCIIYWCWLRTCWWTVNGWKWARNHNFSDTRTSHCGQFTS